MADKKSPYSTTQYSGSIDLHNEQNIPSNQISSPQSPNLDISVSTSSYNLSNEISCSISVEAVIENRE